ncbi:MAG: hypothetical protein QOE45_3109 [Frankiaceae bacterium]|jgi:hypothetical protein|nr:hypothetical protein [Frankiaceae bacterium]
MAVMSEEHGGPLSYSLEPAAGDASAERPIVWGSLGVIATLVLGLVGGWFALGFVANPRVIVVGIPLLMIVVADGLALWGGRRHRRKAVQRGVLAVTVIALCVAWLTNHALASIKPALPQVRYTLSSLDLPPGFHLVDESSHGDRFCHHGCPTVRRYYTAPDTDPDPVKTLVLAMFDQGWHRTSDVAPESATVAARGEVTAQLAERSAHVVEITVSRNQ